MDEAADSREPVFIHRRGGEDVALIAADELRSLLETAHLLRSPKDAERLIRALNRALARTGRASSVESLRKELGRGEE